MKGGRTAPRGEVIVQQSQRPDDREDPSVRHMTATGFVVYEGRVLLHWHHKNRLWLPFGGHIEENEDPVQTVLREVEEESGIAVELLPPVTSPFAFAEPHQLPPPETILLERAFDGNLWHQHIDMIYFCRPVAGVEALAIDRDPTLRWLDAAELAEATPVAPDNATEPAPVPNDVRLLAIEAINRSQGTHR